MLFFGSSSEDTEVRGTSRIFVELPRVVRVYQVPHPSCDKQARIFKALILLRARRSERA
jgi:hypothetical protein